MRQSLVYTPEDVLEDCLDFLFLLCQKCLIIAQGQLQYIECIPSKEYNANNFAIGPTINITDKVKLTSKGINHHVNALDMAQSTLLFHYLENKGLILKHTNESLSRLIYCLTGYSGQNIRTNHLPYVQKLKQNKTMDKKGQFKDKSKNNDNLLVLKKKIEELLSEIEDDISKR